MTLGQRMFRGASDAASDLSDFLRSDFPDSDGSLEFLAVSLRALLLDLSGLSYRE